MQLLRLYFIGIFSSFLVGCAGITKTQREAISAFAKSAEVVAAAAVEIKSYLDDIVYETALLEASSLVQADQYLQKVEKAQANNERDKAQTEKIRSDYGLLLTYTGLLEALSSEKHLERFKKSGLRLSKRIDTVFYLQSGISRVSIPESATGFLYKVVGNVQKYKIRRLQQTYIAEAILACDTLVGAYCVHYRSSLDSAYRENYLYNYKNFEFAFRNFYNSVRLDSSQMMRWLNFTEMNTYWTKWYTKKRALDKIMDKNRLFFIRLRMMHRQLLDAFTKKGTWEEQLFAIRELQDGLDEIMDALNLLKNDL